MTMLTEKFDAYGDVLPDVARDEREAAKTASAVLSRIGQYAFWLLVIAASEDPAMLRYLDGANSNTIGGAGTGAGGPPLDPVLPPLLPLLRPALDARQVHGDSGLGGAVLPPAAAGTGRAADRGRS